MIMTFPDANEYAPFYSTYISKVSDQFPIEEILRKQAEKYTNLLNQVPESKHEFRYAPGKWSLKEVLGHINDTERIMSYRALRVGRGDQTPLPGFDQDSYIPGTDFNQLSLNDLKNEFQVIRQSTLILLQHMPDEALIHFGTASGYPVTTRALFYIIAGHLNHHQGILEERYI